MSAATDARQATKTVLVIDAFEPDDADRHLVDATVAALEQRGWSVELHSLVSEGFVMAMSADERRHYHTDDPLRSDDTRRAAEAVGRCQALVFCHPTSLFGVPPILKGWLDRVLVLGVAFEFSPAGRIRPAMRHVRRIGVVSTTHHGRVRTARARDLTHRTLGRTLWLSCSRRCRRTFVRVPAGSGVVPARGRVELAFRRW